jgi:hypothetical protein
VLIKVALAGVVKTSSTKGKKIYFEEKHMLPSWRFDKQYYLVVK